VDGTQRAAARHLAWHGSEQPAAEQTELIAGPLRAVLAGPDIRYIRYGATEVVQRIYVAVRDTVWNTVPGRMVDLEVLQSEGSFQVRFGQRHTYKDLDFAWTATISGSADGVLTYEMDGEALCDFRHNKIGLNIHHPLPEYTRRPYRASTPGGEISGIIDWDITPQLVVHGNLTAMFPDYNHLEVDLASGCRATFDFEGDQFEMQDHRNWSDGNYKTYGTPLALGYPFDVKKGQRIHQRVTLRVDGPMAANDPGAPVEVRIREAVASRLPRIGLGMSSDGTDLSDRQIRRLRALQLAHLRVDLHPRDDAQQAEWERAVRAATALGCGLEVALFVTSAAIDQAADFAATAKASGVPIARVLVFEEADGFSELRGATEPDTVRAVRGVLRAAGIGCDVAGGTNQFFNELNRSRPDTAGTDGLAFSLNPQVHAGDDLSLADNLMSESDIVRFSRKLFGHVGVFLTPITLIGRNGPFPSGPPEEDGLPGAVDVRQASLLGAAWTAASIKQLAAGGADSITYYETTGWRGVLESENGSPRPDLFPSRPGDVFPIYHVLADVADWIGGVPLETLPETSHVVDALVVRDANSTHVLLVNLTSELRRVRLGPLGGTEARLRVMDDASTVVAVGSAEAFRSATMTLQPLEEGWLGMTLTPYAVVRADIAATRENVAREKSE
jgi:D-apionolactonase